MTVHELKYSNTNTYLIEGRTGRILFDTGWAGSFPAFCRCLGETGIRTGDITCILISHFHPDHMGIAQEIADHGPVIAVADVQREYVHAADAVFEKEGNRAFRPVRDDKIRIVPVAESRAFLAAYGIGGEILHTPGHSDDSISLFLDDGDLFVGDLNPLYELELHRGTRIGETWQNLLERNPKRVFYGHAKTAELSREKEKPAARDDRYELTRRILRYIDKGMDLQRIRAKTGADPVFIEDVTRMYLTHRDAGVQGILDRIEIKGR